MPGAPGQACSPEVRRHGEAWSGKPYRISGPYTHENLSVFLVHSDSQDERGFVTLDEGLMTGLVQIAEKPEEQVSELSIENQSDRPLYLQEGERLEGGKQDRTIISSLVNPPKSGRVAVPTACIEQSRWHEGKTGARFGFTINDALAPKGVRGAGKIENDQGKVWCCVAVQKTNARSLLKAANTNSSANEMLDSPQVKRISDRCAEALASVLSAHPDAVGVAIVVNGQIEEVNVYPSHALLEKLFPRLVRSYALQAALLKSLHKDKALPAPGEIARFMKEGQEKSSRAKKVATHNEVQVKELEGNKFKCTTYYNGSLVHWQIMKKNRAQGSGAAAGSDIVGGEW